MTFRFFDASIIVGAYVGPTSASSSSPNIGCSSPARSSACSIGGTSPVTARKNASVSGVCCGGCRYAPSRSTSGAALSSALSAMLGTDPCPARPRTRIVNGALIFSAVETR